MTNTSPTYSSSSAYYKTPITAQGTLSFWVPRPIPVASSDQVVTISSSYNLRPDLMAHDLYGDSRLFWVFAMRNPNALAADPLGNFVAGLQIYVSSVSTIKSALGI